MILKVILGVQHYCSFSAILFIVNLLMKTDYTVICVPCMLEHVCYEPFSFKNLQIWKIPYVNYKQGNMSRHLAAFAVRVLSSEYDFR